VPRALLGEEPSDVGSGKKVLDTGLGLKVTVRLGLGRSGSRSRGVRSVFDGKAVEDEASDDAMVGEGSGSGARFDSVRRKLLYIARGA
jgi:hypothetical protein